MWYATKPLRKEMLHEPIYERLVLVARKESVTTYGEIAPLASLDMENPEHREQIGEILGIISTYEHQQNRPLLSAIVIHRHDNIPGEGFFELARYLGLLKTSGDRIAFWAHEVSMIHQTWTETRHS